MRPDAIPAGAMRSMRKGIEDSAYGGTMHQYLPWYGVTAGGILGGAAGAKLMPKKYQLLGTLGGGLLGTAAGLHGGEAIGKKLDERMAKSAAAEEYKPPHPALTAAKSLGGMGVGMLAGYGGMQAADAILKKTRGQGLPRGSKAMWAVPIMTGAGGLAYSHMQQKTLEKMRKDHLARQEKKRGSKES